MRSARSRWSWKRRKASCLGETGAGCRHDRTRRPTASTETVWRNQQAQTFSQLRLDGHWQKLQGVGDAEEYDLGPSWRTKDAEIQTGASPCNRSLMDTCLNHKGTAARLSRADILHETRGILQAIGQVG